MRYLTGVIAGITFGITIVILYQRHAPAILWHLFTADTRDTRT